MSWLLMTWLLRSDCVLVVDDLAPRSDCVLVVDDLAPEVRLCPGC